MLWRLAARNLLRNLQRSLTTGGAILFSVAVLVFIDAWTRGIGVAIREYVAAARLGAIQIHARGYFDRPDSFPLDLALRTDSKIVEFARTAEGVIGVTPRISFAGTASNGVDETMFLATAVDPESEKRVCPRFLEGDLVKGRMLRAGDEGVVVVGTGLAASLKLDLGSLVTVETRDVSGRMNALDLEVVGVASSIMPDEAKWLVVLPLGTAQRLTGLESQATSLVLAVADIERTDEVAASLRGATQGDIRAEVRTWREIGLYFEQAIRTFAFAQGVLLVILACLSVLVVLNASAVTAVERRVELATLMAMGAPRMLALAMFMTEAVLLGGGAGVFGGAAGAAAARAAAVVGIPFEAPYQPVVLVRPDWSVAFVIIAALAAMGASILGSIGPAALACRRQPAEVLRS